jgi:hypothetical protein
MNGFAPRAWILVASALAACSSSQPVDRPGRGDVGEEPTPDVALDGRAIRGAFVKPDAAAREFREIRFAPDGTFAAKAHAFAFGEQVWEGRYAVRIDDAGTFIDLKSRDGFALGSYRCLKTRSGVWLRRVSILGGWFWMKGVESIAKSG